LQRDHYEKVFVHNVGPKFVILGYPVWKILNKSIALWYVHGQVDWKLRVAEKLASIIFSSAPESFRVPSKKINYLGHGIDTESLGALALRTDPSMFTILQVGRISAKKHCDVVLDAVHLFSQHYKHPFRMIFVGATVAKEDVEYLEAMKRKVAQLGLDHEVSFEGGVPPRGLFEYYTRANVTVNVSTTRGVDKVALESAAAGVPVFTTFQAFRPIFGGLADEFVLPDLNQQTAEQLSEALLRLASSGITEQKRAALKSAAVAYASLPVLIQKIISLMDGQVVQKGE
jgi:glycosyltransferase involved in cell wall biosynthesis